jgi:hypothetical protein
MPMFKFMFKKRAKSEKHQSATEVNYILLSNKMSRESRIGMRKHTDQMLLQ